MYIIALLFPGTSKWETICTAFRPFTEEEVQEYRDAFPDAQVSVSHPA